MNALHTAERLLLRTLELIVNKKKKLVVARQRQVTAADKVLHWATVDTDLHRANTRQSTSSFGLIQASQMGGIIQRLFHGTMGTVGLTDQRTKLFLEENFNYGCWP